MNTNLLDALNPAQKEAVMCVEGPSIVLAGAGSGKTRVLTYKTAYMVRDKKIPQENILMVTFTNKAALEMKKRMGEYVDGKVGFVGTFHSLGASILRRKGRLIGVEPDFVIYDTDDKESLLKQVIKEIKYNGKLNITTVAYKISSAKDNLMAPAQYKTFATNEYEEAIASAYSLYQERLVKNSAVDFDDLLFKTVELLNNNEQVLRDFNDQFKYIMVDEFQDTNTAQYAISKLLAGDSQNIAVVGDFSQSIYSWRGAEIRNLTKFETDFNNTKVFHLEQNYRSTQNILSFAYDVIAHNTTHPVLKLYTDNEEGGEVEVVPLETDEEEAIFIASKLNNRQDEELDDIAVLYRINSQSRAIEEAFLHYGIPYVLIGGTRFYARREIKDIIAYIRLYVNPNDQVSRERAEKIGKRRYAKLAELIDEIKEKKLEITSDELIDKILRSTDYLSLYDENDSDDYSRLENIKELRSVALHFPDISQLLEQIALVESEYSEAEKKKTYQGVKLMTMHQAKGLEFNTVFVIGVEDGILPHSRSLYDNHELEEERRLFYVAVTRAKKKLYITYARHRYMYGTRTSSVPSRFLNRSSVSYENDY